MHTIIKIAIKIAILQPFTTRLHLYSSNSKLLDAYCFLDYHVPGMLHKYQSAKGQLTFHIFDTTWILIDYKFIID